jgi:hypothetical protein
MTSQSNCARVTYVIEASAAAELACFLYCTVTVTPTVTAAKSLPKELPSGSKNACKYVQLFPQLLHKNLTFHQVMQHVLLITKYYSVIKSRRVRWAGHVARMGEKRGAHRILVGRPEGRRPLGRPSRRWEDNIKIALQEVE